MRLPNQPRIAKDPTRTTAKLIHSFFIRHPFRTNPRRFKISGVNRVGSDWSHWIEKKFARLTPEFVREPCRCTAIGQVSGNQRLRYSKGRNGAAAHGPD